MEKESGEMSNGEKKCVISWTQQIFISTNPSWLTTTKCGWLDVANLTGPEEVTKMQALSPAILHQCLLCSTTERKILCWLHFWAYEEFRTPWTLCQIRLPVNVQECPRTEFNSIFIPQKYMPYTMNKFVACRKHRDTGAIGNGNHARSLKGLKRRLRRSLD